MSGRKSLGAHLFGGPKVLIAVVLLLAACQTTNRAQGPVEPASDAQSPSGQVAAQTEAAVEEDELVYEPDSLTFDIRLSAALRAAENSLFLKTPAGVNLNEIPEDLDKWLSRIRDKGGTVKAAPLPPDGKPSRSLLGILIDVILFFVGLVKDEIIFSAVDDYDAILYYEEGSGDVKWVVFTPRT